jgi:hypothetical protein
VCEGAKTEPSYLNEIRQSERLSSASVRIIHSELGTQPLKIVQSAIAEFQKTPGFENVFVVFDRDDHPNYANAIAKAEAQDNKLLNDDGNPIRFEAIVSVPSFELWLLLHYEDIQAWHHRDVILRRLRRFIPAYAKGMEEVFAKTRSELAIASKRGSKLKLKNSRLPGDEPYTDVHELVETLLGLKK